MTEVQHINPEGLPRNPAFSHAVSVRGAHKVIYVGGQNAVSSSGSVVGKGDVAAQTRQVFQNLEHVLESAGARMEHVVKWNIMVVAGQPIPPAFQVFQETWGRRPDPPAITVSFVAGLANPDFLVEMDAVAVVPE